VRAPSIVRIVIALLFIGASAPALADVVPPPGDCEKKTEGDACKDYDGKAGACATITYTRTFLPPTPNATPVTSQSSYFGCKVGAPAKKSSGCNVSTTESSTESGGEGIALIFGALVLGLFLRAR
jgi:MYXO-CTERM domain-containing protein